VAGDKQTVETPHDRAGQEQGGSSPPAAAARSREHAAAPSDREWLATDDDLISLFDVWQILLRYKGMIIAVTGAAILAAALAAAVMTPMYRAEVVLAPVTANEDSGRYSPQLERFSGIAALAGVNLSQHNSRKNEALATLESRLLTEQFIEEEQLLPVLFHDLWDQEQGDWKVDDPDDRPTLWDAYELFDQDVRRISEDKRSGLVVLSIEWEDPELATHWGNELVRRVNGMLRERTAQESQKAIGFLQQQLKQVSAVELEQVLHRLIESEMKEIILANINEEFAFRVIDPAAPPGEPFRPRWGQMLALGAALGLAAGVTLSLLLGFSRRSGSSAERQNSPRDGA
jgi:LPS O-antigen subunit length determinant protein (WzzB/FepE family)